MSDQTSEEETDFHLPNELLFQILVRLPVKSLVRFRCVCQFWNSIISKLNFFISHYNSSSDHNVLFRNYSLDLDKEIYSLHSDNAEFQQLETLEFPFKAIPPSERHSKCFTIIGCVNGLVCLWEKSSSKLMLWNPAIRKYFLLPCFPLKPHLEFKPIVIRDLCFGFGFDQLSNEFKVVRFIFHGNDASGGGWDECTVVVFSLNRRSWRTLDYSPPLQLYSRSCNVGRFVYRMTQGLEIMSFDLSTEVFARISCPEEVLSRQAFNAELLAFRDSLALLEEQGCARYHIWVMRDDGVANPWTKIFSVNLDHDVQLQRILGFTITGKMLVVGEGEVSVSPVVEDVQVVKYVSSSPRQGRSWHMEPFKESLFLLTVGNNLPILGNDN